MEKPKNYFVDSWGKTDDKIYLAGILFAYVISRLYFYLIPGLTFSYFPDGYVQYLDIALLKSHFLKSIFYLHSQPPLFNFFIGIVENISSELTSQIFNVTFVIIGLLTNILLFKILRKLKISSLLSFSATIFYLISPATLLYENLFFYTHIVIFFLIFASFFLILYLENHNAFHLFYFFLFLSLCFLTTSFFHLSWFLIILTSILILERKRWKLSLKAVCIPLFLVLALLFKNQIVFGEFSSSTWLGMNLSRITVNELPEQERIKLVQAGKLSEIALLPPFPDAKYLFESKSIKSENSTHIDVLDRMFKNSGHTNYNNQVYIKASHLAMKDDIYVIINYPAVYTSGIFKSFKLYFDSPTKFNLLEQNVAKIKTYNRFFNSFIYGSSPNTTVGYFSIILIPMMLVLALLIIFGKGIEKSKKYFSVFLIFNIVYVMIIGNFLELGENNRFRYYTEIFHIIIWALIIESIINKKSQTKNS